MSSIIIQVHLSHSGSVEIGTVSRIYCSVGKAMAKILSLPDASSIGVERMEGAGIPGGTASRPEISCKIRSASVAVNLHLGPSTGSWEGGDWGFGGLGICPHLKGNSPTSNFQLPKPRFFVSMYNISTCKMDAKRCSDCGKKFTHSEPAHP
jgi:hypothetical protein